MRNDTMPLPDPSQDGITHLNTHISGKTALGKFLAPGYDDGEPINHPLLGPFRTVENLMCYANSNGVDKLRSLKPKVARDIAKLHDSYTCNKFRELIRDGLILKVRQQPQMEHDLIRLEIPFEHYFLYNQVGVPIRPPYGLLYIRILNDVKSILTKGGEHQFVKYQEIRWTKRK